MRVYSGTNPIRNAAFSDAPRMRWEVGIGIDAGHERRGDERGLRCRRLFTRAACRADKETGCLAWDGSLKEEHVGLCRRINLRHIPAADSS